MAVETHSTSSIDFKARKKAALISLLASFVVLGLKAFAYYKTHSTAVLSDTLESIINVITAIIALFVIHYVSQPADEEHPYGHGKAEYFSAAFEGGLIFFAAVMIVYEGVKALITVVEVHGSDEGLSIIGVATLFNLVLGFYLKKVGEKEKSETLIASGAHVLSDVKTTLGVAIALVIVKLFPQLQWFDPAMAIAVSLHLAWEGFGIVKSSIGALIDETDTESLTLLSTVIKKHRTPTIIDIHHLRAIRSGSFHHIDAHIVVPEFLNIAEAHDQVQIFEKKVVRDYPYDGEIAFHMDPCNQDFCGKCEASNCPVRKRPLNRPYSFSAEDMIKGPQKC